MPIDTEQWRASTGLFCASHVLLRPPKCKQPQPKVQADTLSLNMRFSLAVLLVTMRTGIVYASRTLQLLWLVICHASWLLSSVVRLSCRRLRGVSVLLALCLVVVQMLLIMSGDVEENPGPPKKQAPSLGLESLKDVHKELLGVSDLSCVREELLDVSHKWFDIGLKLKLSVGTLERVRDQYSDPATALREMLLHWLKKIDPPPTWEGLACALESRTVGEPRMAEQLRIKREETAARKKEAAAAPTDHEFKEGLIETNLAIIRGKFACLLEFMEKKLQQKLAAEIIKRELRLFVIRLFNVSDSSIPVSSDVSVIFEAMRSQKLLTYLNIAGLEQISMHFCEGDSEVESKMEQYKKDRSGFELATEIKESGYISKARSKFPYRCDEPASDLQPRRTPAYHSKVAVKLEHRVAEYHLDYLRELWKLFSTVLSLPPLYLVLDADIMNSVLVEWLIPTDVVPEATEKAKQNADLFKKYPILKVTIGDDCVYSKAEPTDTWRPFVPVEEEQFELDKERQQIRKWMSEAEGRALHFLAVGRGGVGKSALINNLLELDKGSENAAVERKKCHDATITTTSVSAHTLQLHRNGIDVVAFDTSGFQDPNIEDLDIIAQIVRKTREHVDVFLYCASLRQRISREDYRICSLLTKSFGKSVWAKAIFVLTRANDDDIEQKSADEYAQIIANGKTQLQKAVKAAGVPEDVVAAIPVCTAGYTDPYLKQMEASYKGTWQDRIYTEMIRRADPETVPEFSWGETILAITSRGGFLAGEGTGAAIGSLFNQSGACGGGGAFGFVPAAVHVHVHVPGFCSEETPTIVKAQYQIWKENEAKKNEESSRCTVM